VTSELNRETNGDLSDFVVTGKVSDLLTSMKCSEGLTFLTAAISAEVLL
jgi:hypothetical protein